MSTVIKVEGLSKLYRLGEVGTGSLAHDVNRWWHKARGKEDPYLKIGQVNDRTRSAERCQKSKIRSQETEVRRQKSEDDGMKSEVKGQESDLTSDLRSPTSDYVYALKDISFDVNQGEVLGIIGRNGAGKSTLLKILSRVTVQTTGRIRVKGRIASLLEVGTGFHPELTGRENIFLNGAILGMRKAEIKAKFDEIVDFSGCERYIDTPVKRYSSGMYVRLAFAVAAHLEPEILIVDEVLAVGDAEFQKKCLGKMKDVAGHGRTVLFVSHQIPAVIRLCRNVLWLDNGMIKDHGEAASICSRYFAVGSAAMSKRTWEDPGSCPGNEWVRLTNVEACSNGSPAEHVEISDPIEINVDYRVVTGGKVLIPNIHLYSADGTLLFIAHDWESGWREKPRPPGRYRTTFTIPGNFFNDGRITVKVAVSTYNPFEVHVVESDVIAFTIIEETGCTATRGDFAGNLPGVIRPLIPTATVATDI